MEDLLNGLDPGHAALLIGSGGIEVGDDTGAPGAAHPGPEFNIGDLAASFSAIGGVDLSGEACAALALEIVFSQIVERARQITGATSACIVLKRGTEVIRGASKDAEARGLPDWLDIGTGLAAECITTQQVQRCDDVLSDQRPAAQIYRPLGLHSLLLLPLAQNAEVVGLLGVCSSRPCAFTDRAERALLELTKSALDSVRSADASVVRAFCETPMADRLTHAQQEMRPMDAPVVADEPVADEPVTNNARQDTKKFNARHALIFGLGGVALISTASMSMLIGIHVGRQRAMEDFVRSAAPVASSTPPKSEAQAAVPPPNATPTAAHATDVPNGSLLIYQEGKEVLRQVPPAAVDRRGSSVAATHASAVDSHPPGNTSSDPLNRVEPEYPPQALQDGIQGPVVLDLYIDKDGSVQRVSVVSGPALLADAATTAVKQWRFRPRVINSRQVSMQTRVTVRFSLPKP